MSSAIQYLRKNKFLVIGLIVTPLGLYSGIRLKEWRTENKINTIKQQVNMVQQQQQEQLLDPERDLRIELQDLRAARASLLRQEHGLGVELDSIGIKLRRLDEQEEKKEIVADAKK
ncbi:hypothetical protein LPJ66_002713 [Kickxella alabastrina]|uniref:Uncharacterized protein n=1 Tax=Kickxella alabastrina TaxID=61397 RepID=A0ACC1IPP5_9FUNG|nr:hypothetical protein LPJ66_002713 [Kickxella alabastrina]